jgi:succinate dehydrogenase/fumarate reductase flavoprotein subunit
MNGTVMKARVRELPGPMEAACPYEQRYSCDVAVIGCGFAGLNAAVTAKENGQSVLVIDKGRPGYSGLSPWPSSFRWFDPARDDAEACRNVIMKGGEYIANLDWYNIWIKESKNIYERLTEWKILAQFPKTSEAGDFFEREDFVGYRETFDKFDRHQRWTAVLRQNGIPYLEHTMVFKLLYKDGKVNGVAGFHVPSGQSILVQAKAVVLATGGGCYKPTGFPVGGDTFDGEYMCYKLGLPISGKEFEDFHGSSSVAPGSAFWVNNWTYLENIWLCGGDMQKEDVQTYVKSKGMAMVMKRVKSAADGLPVVDGSEIQSIAEAPYTRRGASVHYGMDGEEIRSGKMNDDMPAADSFGAAVGMCSHLASGVFCGLDDFSGSTGLDGLFVAGDGIHSTSVAGAGYPCGVGFTSCFCSIDGDHAGKAAAVYASKSDMPEITEDQISTSLKEISEPMNREKGIDPNWACDVLQSIMAPYWVLITKSEPVLKAALTQIEFMRDNVVPNLIARTGHELRLCLEMKHKVLSAEMKLRASLARKESRGNTYRTDYPYRDDKNFLCYITLTMDPDGKMTLRKVPVKESWTGDTAEQYNKRYIYYFPGEAEAVGFEEQKPEKGRR